MWSGGSWASRSRPASFRKPKVQWVLSGAPAGPCVRVSPRSRLARLGYPHGGCQLLTGGGASGGKLGVGQGGHLPPQGSRRAPTPTPHIEPPGAPLSAPGRPKGTCLHPCPLAPAPPIPSSPEHQVGPDEGEQAVQRPLPARSFRRRGCPATAPAPQQPGGSPRRPPCPRPLHLGRAPAPASRPFLPGRGLRLLGGARGGGCGACGRRREPGLLLGGPGGAGLAIFGGAGGDGFGRARASVSRGEGGGSRAGRALRAPAAGCLVTSASAAAGASRGSGRGRVGAGLGGPGGVPGGAGGAQAGPPERDPLLFPSPASCPLLII